jgi:hypothetical protein
VYKNTKKVRQQQNICKKIACFSNYFSNFACDFAKIQTIITFSDMDLTGKVIAIMEARGGVSARTGNPWMTHEYVLEIPGQYPRKMVFNIFGEDKIKQFNIQPGEEITVQFDIDAREYNGRWFNDIRAWNILRGQAAGTVPAATSFTPQQDAAPQAATSPFPPAQEPAGENTADDLPF